jgi:hypothetical protein
MTFQKLAEIGVDFNTSAPGGLIKASKRFLVDSWRPLAAGLPLLMSDADGNSCIGILHAVHGMSVTIAPIWDTWMSGTGRTKLQFSGVGVETFSGTVPQPPSTAVAARPQLTLIAA